MKPTLDPPPPGMFIPCRANPERQFPNSDPQEIEAAKTVCLKGNAGRRCEFIERCLEQALHVNYQGIWAATTEDERAKIRRRKGVVPLPVVVSPYSMRHYRQKAAS